MELCVMSPVLNSMGLEGALKYLNSLGVGCMELGAGGYPGKNLCDAADYLANPEKIDNLKKLLEKYNVKISALACHGNPIHPNKETAKAFHDDFVAAMKLAAKLGVDTIVGFSGCPGDCENSKNPNWVTCAWPSEYGEILEWQWNEVLIPYWKKTAELAKEIGIKKIAFEMHPGFCVYNPETLLRLRAAVGDIIGANFDPSHLFWQGIDPVYAIKKLKGAIHHFHAKDTKVDEVKKRTNGVLDTKSLALLADRTWIFRTVGYGHGADVWNDIISTLKICGYDGVVSIEHEDGLMSPKEGLEKAVDFLKKVLIHENAAGMWWT